MDLQSIVYILANIFMTFAINKFMKVFFKKRRTSPLIYFLIYLTYPIIISTPFFLSANLPFINMLCSVIALFIITLNYESTWRKRITAVCFIYPFMFIADVLSSSLFGYFHISPVEQREGDYTLTIIIVSLLLYLESILAQNFKNIRKQNPVSSIFWLSSFVIPLASIFIAIIVLNSSNTSQVMIISFVVLIFLINILTFYLHDSLSAAYADRLKSSLYEQEKEYYYNQCELMRETIDEVKSYKHDIKNHLSTANNFIKHNKSDEASEYLLKLIGEVETNTIYSNTGNVAFDSIINYKLRNAMENNIELQIKVSVPQKLKIDVVDVVTILGNLLDNAVNATLKSEQKKISLNLYYSKGRILIKIENTYNGEIKREHGEIVSLSSSTEHGYGLKNVNKCIDKYNGLLEISHTEFVFSVDVLMYVRLE